MEKNENFQNFMYNIYDKLWGDDITNSLIWIFIRTGQEMFSEKMWNFKMSQLPYFLSDFHHFCTNLWGNFYSFFWNYVNSGLDFPFKKTWLLAIKILFIWPKNLILSHLTNYHRNTVLVITHLICLRGKPIHDCLKHTSYQLRRYTFVSADKVHKYWHFLLIFTPLK